MRHFPIFLDTRDRRIVVVGGQDVAMAKIRLLARSEARIEVFAPAPSAMLRTLAAEGTVQLFRRAPRTEDLVGAALVYAATDDDATDQQVAALARGLGIAVNVVDNLAASDFITPAIVDRDPVTVAIGTEGTAPVLARLIKAEVEAILPAALGQLAQAAGRFREAASVLPQGRPRRAFWADFFLRLRNLDDAPHLLAQHVGREGQKGGVDFLLIGGSDTDLLTLASRRILADADVVVHHPDIARPILDLARREARFVPTLATDSAVLVAQASAGRRVIRLTDSPATLAMESAALNAAGVAWAELPSVATYRMCCSAGPTAPQPETVTNREYVS